LWVFPPARRFRFVASQFPFLKPLCVSCCFFQSAILSFIRAASLRPARVAMMQVAMMLAPLPFRFDFGRPLRLPSLFGYQSCVNLRALIRIREFIAPILSPAQRPVLLRRFFRASPYLCFSKFQFMGIEYEVWSPGIRTPVVVRANQMSAPRTLLSIRTATIRPSVGSPRSLQTSPLRLSGTATTSNGSFFSVCNPGSCQLTVNSLSHENR